MSFLGSKSIYVYLQCEESKLTPLLISYEESNLFPRIVLNKRTDANKKYWHRSRLLIKIHNFDQIKMMFKLFCLHINCSF